MKEKNEINIAIGRRIKQNREAAGFTQEAFAEMIGLGVKRISAIERGVAGASAGNIRAICKALSISSDSLLLGEHDNSAAYLSDK